MIKESEIMYERGNYWVLRVSKGFEVYRNTINPRGALRFYWA